MALLLSIVGLLWGAHKSLAPRARTLLGGLGQATLSFFAVATLLFVFFGECPKFCDLAKQRRKIVGGVSEVGKDDFSLYFFWRCVIFLEFFLSSAAIARRTRGSQAGSIFLGMDLRSISPLYITFRFDTCMEHLNTCRMHF